MSLLPSHQESWIRKLHWPNSGKRSEKITPIPTSLLLNLSHYQKTHIFLARRRLYVCHCYPQLWNVCLSALDRPGVHNLAILGNPGIGKTFFRYLILLHLARCKTTVVYKPAGREDRFLFCGEIALAGSNMDLKIFLSWAKHITLWMPIAPDYYTVKTILVTSPRPEIWSDFHKDDCKRLYMPVWIEQEIFNVVTWCIRTELWNAWWNVIVNGAALHAMSWSMQWIKINRTRSVKQLMSSNWMP